MTDRAERRRKTRKNSPARSSETPPATNAAERDELGGGGSFPIVGVGASAGGLEAFTQLLSALPRQTGLGFVLVQHLDPDHQSALTGILSRATSLPVREITNDERVRVDHVYVIPPDTNLTIAKGVLKIERSRRTGGPHRSIDTFFESLAQDQRERAVGVVLSGTANDGTMGLEAIKAEGGITFAQDDSAKHNSMPRSAVAAGCVDLILSPAEISKELVRIASHPYVSGQSLLTLATMPVHANPADAEADGGREGGAGSGNAQNGYNKILLLLRSHSGVDFSLYKPTTIQRRMARRLMLNRQDTLDDYARFARGNAKELDALYSDVLISVTSFFRNPETFDVLQHKVMPELLKQRGDDPLRVWVLGCSTGQEAYSIAMAFVEAAEKAHRLRKLKVFATDLNEAMLEKARRGLYAKSLVAEITPQRLQRFFVVADGGYRINKTLRDMVVFARQNLTADPPFSRVDLISCRNLLIYLEPSAQKKAMTTFHYALKPGGFLLLGASESTGGFSHLFEPVDRKHKIYSRKSASFQALHLPAGTEHGEEPPALRTPVTDRRPGGPELPEALAGELNPLREADRITVSRFAPPGVVVDAELQVLQFRGETGAFLEPPTGKPSFDVLKMARNGLMLPLRSAINQARKQNTTARKENVRVQRGGKTRTVNLEVIPLKNLRERCFLILFEEAEKASGRNEPPERQRADADRSPREKKSRIAELEAELAETREYLQSVQERLETANEEFQASNEEVQSANEELQSSNEELETSKEELESTNEELTTVNEEMSNRNVQLNRLNDDLVNLQDAAGVAVVLLGRDLKIRSFGPYAEKQFDLLAADIGRPIGHIRHTLVLGDAPESALDLEGLCAEVVSGVRAQEREVRDKGGCWYSLRVRPYRTLDNHVDGAVIVVVAIDTLKRSEQAVRESEARYRAMFASTNVGVSETDAETGRLLRVNEQFARIVGYSAEELVGKTILELTYPDDLPRDREGYSLLARGEIPFYEIEKRLVRKDEAIVWAHVTVNLVRDAASRPLHTVVITIDITERKRVEEALRETHEDAVQSRRAMEELNVALRENQVELSESDRRKNEFLAMLGHELRNPLSALTHGLDLLGKMPDDRARREEVRERMVRQTKRMAILLDQLFDIARVITGKVELSKGRVDLADVVREAVETVRPLLESQRHNLTLSLPPEKSALVLGDAIRLAQVVENLLTNAAKYTNEGGQIALTLEADTDKARIVVRDTGIGMSAELLPHIFEVFTQAPRMLDRAKGGMGLGLPLVRRLVEMHEGQVNASSPGPDQGSEFTVVLPRMLERHSKERPGGQPVAEPGKVLARRILVVDDDEDIMRMMSDLLEGDGHQALAVNDGPAALAAIPTFRPEVVLLDLGLPGMDGYEVARRLREEHGEKKILLIAVTGYQPNASRLKEAGFDHHLIKPPDMGKLSSLLAAWASGSGTP
ncbi:MAG: CheR family methyltransferase [Acidobacteriota bacterium]